MNDAASEPEATGDGTAPPVSLGKGRALVPVPRPAARSGFAAGLGRSHGVVAAGAAVVMGIGFVAGSAAFASKPQTAVLARASSPADPTMEALLRVQGEVRALHASLDGLRAVADDARQADTIRGLRRSVDLLKGEIEGVKATSAASAGAVGQLGAKIDRLDRDPGPKLNEIAARLDKLDREPGTRAADGALDKAVEAKLAQATAQVTARLERVERQMASSDATGSIKPQAPAINQAAGSTKPPLPPPRAAQPVQPVPSGQPVQPVPSGQPVQTVAQAAVQAAQPATAPPPVVAVPPSRSEAPRAEQNRPEQNRAGAVARPEVAARPEVVARAEAVPPPRQPEAPARPATVDGWLLRDVYGGVALVEGRGGGLREVAPGEYVPGVGEIRSIERRGRGWVVVTSRGIIQADNRW